MNLRELSERKTAQGRTRNPPNPDQQSTIPHSIFRSLNHRSGKDCRYGIIADDLTGAMDAAATFANCGFTAAVALEPRSLRSLDTQVVALSTHSRHDNSAGARRKVRQACARLHGGGWPVLYKKLDSTVQGNIVAEVEAARSAGRFRTALVCPANPGQGRTVRGGILHVRGGDTVNLQERFHIQGLVEFNSVASPISATKVTRAIEQRHSFILADATSERDLACLAGVVLRSKHRVLLAGSAGLAGELAKLLKRRASARWNPDNGPASGAGEEARRNTLIVTGSNNPVTECQLEKLIGKTHTASLALNRLTRRHAAAALASGRNVIIRAQVYRQPARVVLRQLSALAPLFRARLFDNLLLTGGDTAMLVCRCLRPLAIAVCGEIVPGLAWGKLIGGLADGLTICTKPGGFGSDQSLVRAVEFLGKVAAGVSPGGSRARTRRALGTSQPCPGGRMPPSTAGGTPAATLRA
jgi:uncharacterized protein YgbK (DUF1537 family)